MANRLSHSNLRWHAFPLEQRLERDSAGCYESYGVMESTSHSNDSPLKGHTLSSLVNCYVTKIKHHIACWYTFHCFPSTYIGALIMLIIGNSFCTVNGFWRAVELVQIICRLKPTSFKIVLTSLLSWYLSASVSNPEMTLSMYNDCHNFWTVLGVLTWIYVGGAAVLFQQVLICNSKSLFLVLTWIDHCSTVYSPKVYVHLDD